MNIMYFCVSTTDLQLLSRSENLPIQILINQYLDKYNLIWLQYEALRDFYVQSESPYYNKSLFFCIDASVEIYKTKSYMPQRSKYDETTQLV